MTMKKFLTILALFSVSLGYAGGFSILEQTAEGLGRALAGVSADTEDPAALYFNPATPVWHDKPTLSFSLHLLGVNGYFNNHGSDPGLGDEESGDLGCWTAIPNIYYVHPITSSVAFGLGISATSGTKTDYQPTWIGRYDSIDTEIAVVDINPVIAWKVLDELSIGAGPIIEYADATMKNMIPFNAMTGVPSMKDGRLILKGDGVGIGYSLGILYRPFKDTKIGLGYRSRMTIDLDMRAKVRDPNHLGLRCNTDADSRLKLPRSITLGVEQGINEKWKVMGEVAWYEWSCMDHLRVKFDDKLLDSISSSTTVMNWGDTWRFSVGTSYQLTEKLLLRTGFCFDKTPVKSNYRNMRLPDSNRYWVSLGMGYQLKENITLDFAYTHLFMEDVGINQVQSNGMRMRGKVVDCQTNIFSFGIKYSF